MPRKNNSNSELQSNSGDAITSIKYPAKRKNIPPAGLEAQGVFEKTPSIRHEYNPHLPPALRSAKDAAYTDRLPELLAVARKRALSPEEAKLLADALRRHEPWLEWSGKREKPWFEVDPVALHMHERISTQAILGHPRERTLKMITYLMGSFSAVMITTMSAPFVPSDPDDEIFLLCAIDGNADYLISEDHSLTNLKASYNKPLIGKSSEMIQPLGA